jgi:hypothetical protein
MKYILLAVTMITYTSVIADQRFETNNGFCHFVLNPNNANNEVFFANCQNSIVQNDDGTGTGTTYIRVQFPIGDAPIAESLALSGDETGIACNMVDSNGTQYTTNDWTSEYVLIENKGGRDYKHKGERDYKHKGERDHEHKEESDYGRLKHRWHDKNSADTVIFSLICRNAQQQQN